MDETVIRKRIGELCEVMTVLPPGGSGKSKASVKAHGSGVYVPKTSIEAQSIEDSFDHLRLQLKYLMFDLEATRRENKYLRQMIENRRGPRSGDCKDGLSDF